MTNEYYRKELTKLKAILQTDTDSITVSSEYVIEKIDRILNGIPIGIHPSLKPVIFKEIIKNEYIPTVAVLHNIDPSRFSEKEYDLVERFVNEENAEEIKNGRR